VTRSILAALAAVALLAGCGATDDQPDAAVRAKTAAVTTVEMTGSTFAPSTVDVKAGGTVRFVNKDEIAHTATAEGGFDSGTLRTGERFAVKTAQPGTFNYVCIFHPGMTGTVRVS
jgi:plastocyanin